MTLKRETIFNGITLLLVGILFLAAPITTTMVIYGLIGFVIALAGALHLVSGLRYNGDNSAKIMIIIPGILLVIVGIFLLLNPGFLVAYNYIIFGLIMIVNGILNILSAFKGEAQVYGNKVVYIVLSALLLIAGVVVLVHPFAAAELLTMFIGIMLIISGLINLFIALRLQT